VLRCLLPSINPSKTKNTIQLPLTRKPGSNPLSENSSSTPTTGHDDEEKPLIESHKRSGGQRTSTRKAVLCSRLGVLGLLLKSSLSPSFSLSSLYPRPPQETVRDAVCFGPCNWQPLCKTQHATATRGPADGVVATRLRCKGQGSSTKREPWLTGVSLHVVVDTSYSGRRQDVCLLYC